jgi:hypothetical protein
MHQDTWTPLMGPSLAPDEHLTFTTAGNTRSAFVLWFARGLSTALERHGHAFIAPDAPTDDETPESPPARLVLNLCDLDRPRPIHRRGQGTFVVTIVEGEDDQRDVMKAAYPLIVRSLANMVIYNTRVDGVLESHFVTIEQGHYTVRSMATSRRFSIRSIGAFSHWRAVIW